MTLTATTLGTVTLSPNLTLTGLEAAPVVVGQRRTLTGVSVIQTASAPGGRTLTLSGEHHFTLAQIIAVQALSAAGQPVTLNHHRGEFQVVIATIETEATIDYADPDPADWYSCTITLIEA